jgi:predicted transposase YbfD/YdcC
MASGSKIEDLLCRFRLVADPREERGRRHSLVDVLFIAMVAMVSGADDAESMQVFGEANEAWFRQFLQLPHGIPSQDTYLRVFALLDPGAVQTLFRNWVDGIRTVWEGGHVALDGKTLRRSFDAASGGKRIHMVSAWLSDEGLVLGQVKVEEKENEIVAIPELLRLLDIRGVTVTIDAMGCQRAIAAQIVEKRGHYVLSVKENHPTLHEHIEGFFADAGRTQRPIDDPAPRVETHQEVDAGHGRVETRTCWFSRDLSWVDARAEWAGLDGIAMVMRERHDKRTGKTSMERAYFIVSHPRATAGTVARVIRDHWGIENGLHWALDMTFNEDQSRVRARHAAQNLAVLRHLVMNLLRTAPGKKRSLVKRRQRCGWDRSFLLSVLAGREVN